MFSLEETREDLQGASLASERAAWARKVPRPAVPCFAQAHLPRPSGLVLRELISDEKRFVRTQEGIKLAMKPTRPVVCQESAWKEVQSLWILVLEDSGSAGPICCSYCTLPQNSKGFFSLPVELSSFVWPTVSSGFR